MKRISDPTQGDGLAVLLVLGACVIQAGLAASACWPAHRTVFGTVTSGIRDHAIADEQLGLLGLKIHLLGDSYAHRDGDKNFSGPVGHALESLQGGHADPDELIHNPKLYREFVADLVDVMSDEARVFGHDVRVRADEITFDLMAVVGAGELPPVLQTHG